MAYNKKQKENLFEKELDNLQGYFPQLEELKATYPKTEVEKLVALVYQDVIDFARMAARYYQRSGISK